jgi:hypothetical protein
MNKIREALQERKISIADALACLAILTTIAAVFYKTIFLNQPISRLCLAAARDVLFREFLATPTEAYFDESASQHLVPYRFLVAGYIRAGQLPLWNPYSGFGTPMLADLETIAFSPWTILFALAPSISWFNQILIIQITFGALTTYALARYLGTSASGGLIAALAYSLCPFNLFQIELLPGSSSCLIPILFLSFAAVWKRSSALRIVGAGLSCAVFISSSHPEISFVAIIQASVLLVFLTLYNRRSSTIEALGQALKTLTAVGFFACCFSAPLLSPFIELLRNSDAYKFDSKFAQDHAFRFKWFITNLFQATARGNAPFLGILAPLLGSAAIASKNYRKSTWPLLGCGLVALVQGFRPWPVNILLNQTALNFSGFYYLPVVLLTISICAGFGLDALRASAHSFTRFKLVTLGAMAIGIVTVPIAIHFLDIALNHKEPTPFVMRSILQNALTLAICILAIYFTRLLKTSTTPFTAMAILLNVVSLLFAARFSLPTQGHFHYRNFQPLNLLKERGERTIGIGWDIFRPNNNLVYEIPAATLHTVLFPKRFRAFMAEAGAELLPFEVIMLKTKLSRLLDLASLKYAISLVPIRGEDDIEPKQEQFTLDAAFKNTEAGSPPLTLSKVLTRYDQNKSQIAGTLCWKLPTADFERYLFTIAALDQNGNVIWFGGLNALAKPILNSNKEWISEVSFSAIYPLNTTPTSTLSMGVTVYDTKTKKAIEVEKPMYTKSKQVAVFHKASPSQSTGNQSEHYKLIGEYGSNHIRLYENAHALPRAYLVHRAQVANSEKEALSRITKPSFEMKSTVVIEPTGNYTTIENDDTNEQIEYARITKSTANDVTVAVQSNSSGVLVLNDTFYPGWSATIDGIETPIHRANYLFRGVQITKGNHEIKFHYFPLSFSIGLLLLALGTGAAFASVVTEKAKANSKSTNTAE